MRRGSIDPMERKRRRSVWLFRSRRFLDIFGKIHHRFSLIRGEIRIVAMPELLRSRMLDDDVSRYPAKRDV
jgi:hypothetical protein